MKLFICLCLFFSFSASVVAEVDVAAELVKPPDGEWILKISLKNNSENPVFIPTLSDEWIDLRLDFWSLGKGIELYAKHDAEWRRADAFVDYKWRKVSPGQEVATVIAVAGMMPTEQENDHLAKSILEDFFFLKKGRAYLDVIFKTGSGNSEIQNKCYKSVEFRISKHAPNK